MKAQRKQFIIKVLMIIFLVLVVIGFTVPIFLNNIGPAQNTPVEPRVCQTDTDCALTCDSQPVAILCSQNLCQQNVCNQNSYYSFTQTPITFTLRATIETKPIDFAARANTKNFFVTFDKETVKVYAQGLTLTQIFEKINLKINSQCLTIDQAYCTKEGHKASLIINNKESYAFDYSPQAGDVIELVYS